MMDNLFNKWQYCKKEDIILISWSEEFAIGIIINKQGFHRQQ